MKFNLTISLYLLTFFPLNLLSQVFHDILSKNSTIVHLNTGLFLKYVGLYSPSDTIIHNSVIFPMTTTTCYFLPLSAAVNIPSCNVKKQRMKREITGLIALGSGIINFGMTTRNMIKLNNLQTQMNIVKETLSKFNKAIELHEAKLINIQLNQIKFVQKLRITHNAIRSILPILDSHSKVLNQLQTDITQLHHQFQHSFLYLAINRIFHNELNLNFLLPNDLRKVVYNVIKQGNISLSYLHGSIPLVEIITKLLIRQQIDFIPILQNNKTNNSKQIGYLVITNYFFCSTTTTTTTSIILCL